MIYKALSGLANMTDRTTTSKNNPTSRRSDNAVSETETIRQQTVEIKRLNQALDSKTTSHSRALEEAQALTHLGSWEWDIQTDKISWSDELYRIYGMKPQERVIGFEEFIGLIHPDDRDSVQSVIHEAYQSGQPFEFEHRIILPDHEEKILKGMGKIVTGSDGKPVRMLGTSQDITQAKQLDRAKDEFISLVSHQLRTPLSVIRIHGNVLEEGLAGTLDPKQESHIRTMTQASIRLIDLVDDILRISRISLNRIKVNAAPSSPNELIQKCIENIKPIIETRDTKISFTPDDTIGLVAIDKTIFSEILSNLVHNAVRYSPSSNGEIDISFTKDQQKYLLSVRDNGIGIPKADQAYIFDRFYRANNATLVDSEGNGLGLYIVKLFVEAVGGKVWIDSAVNKGTTFYVSFEAASVEA